MKRRMLFGAALSGLALLSLPSSVIAQGFPPDPPATFYGAATGGTAGQGVVAIVLAESGISTVCGTGAVQTDNSGPVYVVDVISDAQRSGCGKNGRQVRFYFTPTAASGGRLANETGTWSGAGPKQLALTLGAPLGVHRYGVQVASDGTN